MIGQLDLSFSTHIQMCHIAEQVRRCKHFNIYDPRTILIAAIPYIPSMVIVIFDFETGSRFNINTKFGYNRSPLSGQMNIQLS